MAWWQASKLGVADNAGVGGAATSAQTQQVPIE